MSACPVQAPESDFDFDSDVDPDYPFLLQPRTVLRLRSPTHPRPTRHRAVFQTAAVSGYPEPMYLPLAALIFLRCALDHPSWSGIADMNFGRCAWSIQSSIDANEPHLREPVSTTPISSFGSRHAGEGKPYWHSQSTFSHRRPWMKPISSARKLKTGSQIIHGHNQPITPLTLLSKVLEIAG